MSTQADSYRTVFKWSPVAHWEQDFSQVQMWLRSLRRRGVTDLAEYLAANPGELDHGIGLVEVLSANPASLRLIGASIPDQLFSPHVLTQEVRDSFAVPFLTIWEGRDSYDLELTGSTMTGEPIDVALRWVAPVIEGEPDYSRVVIAIIDVSGRAGARITSDVTGLFSALFTSAPTATALADLDGRFLGVNQALSRFLQYSEDQLLTMRWQDLTHPQDLEPSQNAVADIVSGHTTSVDIEKRYVRSDGEEVWGRLCLSPVYAADGSVEYLIGQLVDITGAKAATEELEHLLRSKDTFVAGVAHELRTPLTAVVGFAELLRSGESPLSAEEREEMIETIASEAIDLTNIVEDLLVATRAQIGELAVIQVSVDLGAQLSQTLEALGAEDMARITVRRSTAHALGDPARVRQILRNLISNALRYGGPKITISVISDQSTGSVTVNDDGEGIPPGDQDRVFESFERGRHASAQSSGVGLGLPVSRSLARAMGGDISYRRTDRESVFHLTLPHAENNQASSESKTKIVLDPAVVFQSFRDLFEL